MINSDLYTALSTAFKKEVDLAAAAEEKLKSNQRSQPRTNIAAKAKRSSPGARPTSPTPMSPNALSGGSAPDPIILMSAYPISLDPDDFKDALSTSNPNGNLIPLWRFRQLVDPIPQFSNKYVPSTRSLESYYDKVVNGASASDPNSFTGMILSDAIKDFATQTFSNLDGTSGKWRPVYAMPDDWYDIKPGQNVRKLDIDLSTIMSHQGESNMAEHEAAEWQILNADQTTKTVPVDPSSNISTANVDYQMVSLHRPWYNPILFDTSGWFLTGQNAGFCSSGKNDGKGIIPMVPSGIILGTQVNIQANWSAKDQKIIDDAQGSDSQLSLGPLMVSASSPQKRIHVIGWVMSPIPFSPRVNG